MKLSQVLAIVSFVGYVAAAPIAGRELTIREFKYQH